ncbi:Reverse transcriptase domain-containing protein [Abeliophyllum distichum]|uniref:Reverse transcriptase domain-containing protein n=1 Tax=Abeliophyllum distichum TaxID=126358 RepID=A0ABD1THK9_9LAMI
MNLPFWRDVHNKNPTIFDQLVELITEEITNENMILHRNRGGVAPNQVPMINYGKIQVRHLPQPPPRRRDYPADLKSGISYVASAQEGLLPPYQIQMAPGSSTEAYNYGMAVPTYYEMGTGSLSMLPPRQETSSKYCLVYRSHGHSTEECSEVENLASRREANSGPRRGANTKRGIQSPMHHRRPPGSDRRSSQWKRRPANQDSPRRSSRSSVRLPRAEVATEHRFIKGPEKPPIREIDTICGGPYIGGQSRNAQKSYAKEAVGKLMTNWLINGRPSGSSKVDPISFTEEDMRGVHYPHCDALVVRAVVARNGLGRMLVDNGSSVNIIFSSTYEQMNIDVPLEPSTEPLYGFTGDCVTPKGIICLAVTMGEEPLAAHTFMEFLVVDRRSAYHGVLGRPALKELWAVTSIHHLCMKFSTEGGIATIRGNQPKARKCYRNALRKAEKKEMNMTICDVEMEEAPEAASEDVEMEEASFAEDIDPRITGADSQTSSIEELESFLANPDDPTKKLQVGKDLIKEPKEALKRCLRDNLDVFAWRHEDMIGIHPKISCHHLNIDPKFPSHRQKRRPLNLEKYEALKEEVSKLLQSNFIREAWYPKWVSNPVLVKKSNGKMRTCINFSILNQACPKDSFPLPRIDQLVDATSGHELLSFMDAYSGYNQISMYPPDEEHMSFVTNKGLYCYKVMPFGLKNAGATYQRLVNKMFADQLGSTMEVYVDDMFVKSLRVEDHIQHLEETFQILRSYKMRLNPLKCAFGVASGKFLGYMVNQRGLKLTRRK